MAKTKKIRQGMALRIKIFSRFKYFLFVHIVSLMIFSPISYKSTMFFSSSILITLFSDSLSKKDMADFLFFCFSTLDNKFHSSSFSNISTSLISSIGAPCSFKNIIFLLKSFIILLLLCKFLKF